MRATAKLYKKSGGIDVNGFLSLIDSLFQNSNQIITIIFDAIRASSSVAPQITTITKL